MASSSAGVTTGANAEQRWHSECIATPGSYCVLSSSTKTAEQEIVPCKQWLTVKGNSDRFQTSPAIFFGEFYG